VLVSEIDWRARQEIRRQYGAYLRRMSDMWEGPALPIESWRAQYAHDLASAPAERVAIVGYVATGHYRGAYVPRRPWQEIGA
jgi:hypothetical protein